MRHYLTSCCLTYTVLNVEYVVSDLLIRMRVGTGRDQRFPGMSVLLVETDLYKAYQKETHWFPFT